MPTIEENFTTWNSIYDWEKQGDEWSHEWGGAKAQWFGTILPRIHNFLPADTILEIAPGFGRWTQFLKNYCNDLAIVDLSENCIEVCKKRFEASSNIAYYVNDGKSLQMLEDESIDLVFSCDSLVHAEADVLEAYLNQLATKLKPNGVGFIHHSNLKSFQNYLSLTNKLPGRIKGYLDKKGFYTTNHHWRATSMNAELFEKMCEKAGLYCFSQELINWGTELLIDTFSLFGKENITTGRANQVFKNKNFMKEASYVKKISGLYNYGNL